jgi:GNAT superfamily N-acetyltransferase
MTAKYSIRTINDDDLPRILASFYWQKREQWERYFEENRRGERVTLVAIQDDRVVGYSNLMWQSDYEPFRAAGIPEIDNMHVLDEYQRQGIATAFITAAEAIAARAGKTTIGIGVTPTEQYAAAQRLYPHLGFIPDGRALQPTPWGDVLHLTKRIATIEEDSTAVKSPSPAPRPL